MELPARDVLGWLEGRDQSGAGPESARCVSRARVAARDDLRRGALYASRVGNDDEPSLEASGPHQA